MENPIIPKDKLPWYKDADATAIDTIKDFAGLLTINTTD